MSQGSRMLLAVGVVLIGAAAIGAGMWVLNEPYAVLFADLDEADAGRVIDGLEQLNRDYMLGEDGRSILVPASEVHDTRIRLMSSGAPLTGGVGFEIFDDAGFGMTEFAQRINYQRALEGELTRTIMALEEVRFARVHVVMPEGGLFDTERDTPSAAVTVFLDKGAVPSVRQIRGIQNLIASAVPRLEPAQVTVTDENGQTLSEADGDDAVAAISTQLERKMEVERYLNEKVNDMLAQAFGPGQAMVSVDVMLDFSEATVMTESIIPNGAGAEAGVVRRRETRSETDRVGNTGPANATTEVEYAMGRSVEQTTERPGRIVRLGVGVVVPADISDERRQAITDLVAVTVGLDLSRGDSIAVSSLAPPSAGRTVVDEPAPTGAGANVGVRGAGVTEGIGVSRVASNDIFGLPASTLGIAAVVVVVVAVLFALLLSAVRAKPKQSTSRLGEHEREQLLRQVQSWLADSPNDEDGVAT